MGIVGNSIIIIEIGIVRIVGINGIVVRIESLFLSFCQFLC